ncbi:hypothetical protein JCM14036_22810 [Desulfotomaculum defluvii]
MTEQSNVINLEQETVNKNTELFVNITTIIGNLINKGLASLSFNYGDCAISFSPTTDVHQAFSQYSVEKVQSITDEVIDLTLKLLEEQEQTLLKQAKSDGKTVFEITKKRIDVVNKHIINNKLKSAYTFYQTTIGNVLDQFIAQKIIKPPSETYPSIETIMVKISTKDNINNSERKTISFEMYGEQIDDMIAILSKIKKDITLKSNQEPQ